MLAQRYAMTVTRYAVAPVMGGRNGSSAQVCNSRGGKRVDQHGATFVGAMQPNDKSSSYLGNMARVRIIRSQTLRSTPMVLHPRT